jgi:transposase
VCDRIKAVLACDDGYIYSEIARLLLLDDESIRRHIKDYRSDKKLSPENGGSECRLTRHESRELIEHLCQKTYLYVKDICLYVKEKYKKYYSVSGLRTWLHTNRFRYKKPHAVPTKIDSAAQEAFIEFYNKLKCKAGVTEPFIFRIALILRIKLSFIMAGFYEGNVKPLRQPQSSLESILSVVFA